MPRYTLISLGIIAIILMFVMWGYLFLYGAPQQSKEVFANLGIVGDKTIKNETRTITGLGDIPKDTARLALAGKGLEQLTTRAVAGFGFSDTTGTKVVYAEKGTGYIYEIDLASGLERQLSGTTVTGVTEAIFSPQSTSVVLTSSEEGNNISRIGYLLGNNELSRITKLTQNAYNIHYKNDAMFVYTIDTPRTSEILERNVTTGEERRIGTIPFVQAYVYSTPSGIAFSPKPAQNLGGALYGLSAARVYTHTEMYPGFSGFMLGDTPIFSYTQTTDTQTHGGAIVSGTFIEQGIPPIAEKCTHHKKRVWCGAPLVANQTFVSDWYKGTISSEDYLWELSLENGSATLVADLSKMANKFIDIDALTVSPEGEHLFFTHKKDGSLWVYKTAPE